MNTSTNWYNAEILDASEYRDGYCGDHGDTATIYREGAWRCVICGSAVNNDDMNTNTDETFTRTAPPLNRFTVKLGGPAPWEVLTADMARDVADVLMAEGYTHTAARVLRYADAVDAMTHPERDMATTDEELFF